MLNAVSLFSNCGAGDVGYQRAGFTFELMAELDERRLEVCQLNHPYAVGIPGDLRNTWVHIVRNYRMWHARRKGTFEVQAPSLLAACPPCQGMSSARSGMGRGDDPENGSKDHRNLLVLVVVEVARALRPKMIVVENVPQFLTRRVPHPDTGEGISAARLLTDELKEGYVVYPISVDLADFGIPQKRRRSFLTFIRLDQASAIELLREKGRAPYPLPTHAQDMAGKRHVWLSDALESYGLPELDARDARNAKAEGFGGLHEVPVWTDGRYPMVQAIPPNSGRSAWQNDTCPDCGEVEVGEEDVVCPDCGSTLLRPVVVERDGAIRLVKGFRTSSYRRMWPHRPAATITTASGHIGSSYTIHPCENRLLSTLECARLQTFPDDFEWGRALKAWGHTNVREMICEAVPPAFTELHGEVLRRLLDGTCDPERLLPVSNVRCTRAAKKLGVDLMSLFSQSAF